MPDGTVMVITREFDPTVDYVIARLHDRGVPVIRLDLAEFPQRCTIQARLDGSRWIGSLRLAHREMDLGAVRSVWYRKPTRFRFHDEMTDTERSWSAGEAKAGLGGLLAGLRCRWVNHPHRNAADTTHLVYCPASSR